MKRIIPSYLVAAVGLGLLSAAGLTASAQVTIISENFDTTLSSGATFSQYFGGNTTSGSTGIVPGAGVGGSGAWQTVSTGASGGNAGYSYYGAQYQNGGVSGNTSVNLSDYVLSFDAMATGGSLNLQIQSWAGAGFGGGFNGTLNTAPASPGYGNDLTLNTTYTHYSLYLGDTSIFQGNSGFLPNGGTLQIAFQLNYGGATPYSEIMNIDNLQLTMVNPVPEPSSLALGALVALGGLVVILRRTTKA